jgi:hypothetical protein
LSFRALAGKEPDGRYLDRVRGVLGVAENGFREFAYKHKMVVVCSAMQPPVVGGDLAVALRTHR